MHAERSDLRTAPAPGGAGGARGLEKFLHGESNLPILIKIGLAHAQFETIHPLLDGNGRVGRLLIAFLLCEGCLLEKPVLYLSHYFKRHRSAYYDLLQATRDAGAWEDWLAFFLRGVAEVSVHATDTARGILLLRETHRSEIAKHLGYAAGNGHRVLEYLYERPIISVNEVKELTGTTYPAANSLVERLVRIGILAEITGRARNRRFRYDAYVDLFDAPDPGGNRSGSRSRPRRPHRLQDTSIAGSRAAIWPSRTTPGLIVGAARLVRRRSTPRRMSINSAHQASCSGPRYGRADSIRSILNSPFAPHPSAPAGTSGRNRSYSRNPMRFSSSGGNDAAKASIAARASPSRSPNALAM